jgi:hypothetical protein
MKVHEKVTVLWQPNILCLNEAVSERERERKKYLNAKLIIPSSLNSRS